MRFLWLAIAITSAACGGGPKYQTLHIVNQTDRPIDQLYVYPMGAADHGASRGALAPGKATDLRVPAGNVEVLGVSGLIQVGDHLRDRPSASKAIELTAPAEIVFYDNDKPPAGLDRPGVYGVAFRPPRAPAGDDGADDGDAPLDEAPTSE